MKKKILALVLCVACCMAFLPAIALAEGNTITSISITVPDPVAGQPIASSNLTGETSNLGSFTKATSETYWSFCLKDKYDPNALFANTWTQQDSGNFSSDSVYMFTYNVKVDDYAILHGMTLSINGKVPTTHYVDSETGVVMICHIWDSDIHTFVNSIACTITPPEIGAHPDMHPTITSSPAGLLNSSDCLVNWYRQKKDDHVTGAFSYTWDSVDEADVFSEDYVYTCDIYVPTISTAALSVNLTGTINGVSTKDQNDIYGSICNQYNVAYLTAEFFNSYDITIGDDQEIMLDGVSSLLATCEGPLANFTSFTIDDEIVDPQYYTVQSGSTFINVGKDYLNTLAPGDHTFQFIYTNMKSAIGHFTLLEETLEDDPSAWSDVPELDEDEPSSSAKKSPKTNDLSLGFMLLLVSGAIVTTKMKKK